MISQSVLEGVCPESRLSTLTRKFLFAHEGSSRRRPPRIFGALRETLQVHRAMRCKPESPIFLANVTQRKPTYL